MVKFVSVDAESVLQACEQFLKVRGVRLLARIPGEHEKHAERVMRVIREQVRVKLIELDYQLPRPLHDYLVSDIVRTMIPNSKSAPLSPRSMVSGEQTNFNVDISPPFGSAVLCPVASAQHGTEQKNEIGVCLGI